MAMNIISEDINADFFCIWRNIGHTYKVITTPTHLHHTFYPMHDLLLPLNDYEYH